MSTNSQDKKTTYHTPFLALSLVVNIVLITYIVLSPQHNTAAPTQTMLNDKEQHLTDDFVERDDSNLPPIVYSPSLNFAAEQKIDFHAKILNPYIGYHTCLNESPIASIYIQALANKDTSYQIDIIKTAGEHHSFIIDKQNGGELPYYTPTMILAECVDTLPHKNELEDLVVEQYRG